MMHLLNLSQYCPTLAAQGYNNVKDVLSISIEDLEDIGFFMLGHQKRLLLGIKRLKELRSGKKLSLPEYHPEEVTMSSLPPTLNSKQSFSSFHALPGKSNKTKHLIDTIVSYNGEWLQVENGLMTQTHSLSYPKSRDAIASKNYN